MNPVNKNDLKYHNRYGWKSEKSINSTNLPLKAYPIFNRHNGQEVLDLINGLMQQHSLSSIKSVEKIETMLINLPFEEQNNRQVSEWITNHWTKKIPFPHDGGLVLAI